MGKANSGSAPFASMLQALRRWWVGAAMANETDRDLNQQARELYAKRLRCPHCRRLVSLFDMLEGRCPTCKGFIKVAPDISPERAAEMLRELRIRRIEFGLAA